MMQNQIKNIGFTLLGIIVMGLMSCSQQVSNDQLRIEFKNPPDEARPGVYWYFMDGNLLRDEMTKDLESMKEVGIGSVLFLEVFDNVPRGQVKFFSEEWQELYKHAVKEAERLGIELSLGTGPGWAGSGGPWVKPEESMRHLVSSETEITGPFLFKGKLEIPKPRRPYFGEENLTASLKEMWSNYYEDVKVLAFPTPTNTYNIEDVDEKALYYRDPFTSHKGVKPYLTSQNNFSELPGSSIDANEIIDITDKLQANGELIWDVPKGKWTIMRFGKRNNGAITRPAPFSGLGFEADKFDIIHINAHYEKYIGELLKKTGPQKEDSKGGWKMIHIDSWEMGAQNWSDNFLEEFINNRGYNPIKFLPTYSGKVVGSLEQSERFLWDVRQTSMELILKNHAGHLKKLGRRDGFTLSIEPYDMNPSSDLDLGAVADIPMGEFWAKDLGFNSSYSCIEATSIAHVHGRPIVGAEAFTSGGRGPWKLYPENVKNQGDWAFCMGINKFMYHTFVHKSMGEQYRPGMTMGHHGAHWDRGQTWWPMASEYHRYIARCQHVLRQGKSVADILYLTPEGAPNVFRPPLSALAGDDVLPDKKGYNFDGCSPLALIDKADVKEGRIFFPEGTSYRVLVLPNFESMTPELLQKIEFLIHKGATVIGIPPHKSPSLVDYPNCDLKVAKLAKQIWGMLDVPSEETEITYGKGRIFWGADFTRPDEAGLFPTYTSTSEVLRKLHVKEDFTSPGSIRYIHRKTDEKDIYFISNRTDSMLAEICTFRMISGVPELWDPVTGEIRILADYSVKDGRTSIPIKLDQSQSFFIVFDRATAKQDAPKSNFPEITEIEKLKGSWEVSFDPKWGGPDKITFEKLIDWVNHAEEGIKFYSGIARYRKTFDVPNTIELANNSGIYLDLGEVKNMARVKLNGKDLGVIWTSPWRVNISDVFKEKENKLEIEIANLWGNRLVGDDRLPDDGVKDGKWPEWFLEGKPRTSGRFTFTTRRFYRKEAPLQSSGLIGPVTIKMYEN